MTDLYLSDIPVELAAVQPLGDFVLVRRLLDTERTASGLVTIPDTARNKREGHRRGVVVKCGPGDKHKNHRLPMHVKEGNEVLYARVPANEIRIDGQEYEFLHEEQHVLAVIEGDANVAS